MACYEILEVNVDLTQSDKTILKQAIQATGFQTYFNQYDNTVSVTGEIGNRYFSGWVSLETGEIRGTRGMTDQFAAKLKQQYARESVNELKKYGWEIEQTSDGVTLTQGGQQW